jgi:signal transduction histidine kinase
MSLRTRLALAFALTAALATSLVGVFVYEGTAADLLGRARDQTAQSARSARDLYESRERLSSQRPAGRRAAPFAPLALRRVVAQEQRVATIVTGSGRRTRVWGGAPAAGLPSGIFVSRSFAEEDRQLAALRRLLVFATLLATGIAAAVGVIFASGLSFRLRRAAAAARRVASGELGARIGMHGSDEVGALALAVDEMADALGERIERERRFAADTAHELRTPISSLVTAAELLPNGRAATIVRDSVDRLRRLIEQLLEIARLEGNLDAVQLDVVDLVSFAHAAQRVFPALEVEAVPGASTFTDLGRLERIAANLAENAFRYGRPPVVLRVAEDVVSVSDHGPGFPEEVMAHATGRFVVGDAARGDGVGLGLSIVAEHVRTLGAELTVANRADGGAVVSVYFPRSDCAARRIGEMGSV